MKTLIIGGGNMGRTYAQSFLEAHILRPGELVILEHNTEAILQFGQGEWGRIESKAGSYIGEQELIILAVKPQDAKQVFEAIFPFLQPEQVFLSIMAGVKMESLEKGLGSRKIVRAMPNLPAQVGMGMTAFTANEEVGRKELIAVQNLLSTTGKAIYFEDENMIDAATAISGSGPAYVYFFMNAMLDAAQKLGFTESQADVLVWQTFIGSVHMLNKKNLTCQEWINRVASKGGTTEAALGVFNEHHLHDAIVAGLQAAFIRAQELGK